VLVFHGEPVLEGGPEASSARCLIFTVAIAALETAPPTSYPCSALSADVPAARRVRKTVTALFADVTGSTALGEQLDPETLQAVLDRYFAEMRSVIERHGGTVEKFIGDAIMAVFGVPHVHEDDALRAVRAAVEMRAALGSLNADLIRDQGVALEARIGVNTGEVVAGDPGSGQSFVAGDAVNVAARLQQAAGSGEILIGSSTRRLVGEATRTEPIEPLMVRGKTEPVPAWRLLEVLAGADALPRRIDSPFVGRERELTALLAACERAEAGACELVTVLGEPGVGKSRLVTEFLRSTADRARSVAGRCLPYGEGITYWPLSEIVRDVAGADGERLAAMVGD
jgi:class 3 adenylate cyclase